MPKRVFITAADVSGDRHSAELARSLTAIDNAITVEGLGGPVMRSAGITIHHETVGGAAMLHHGILRALEMWTLSRWMARHFRQQKPDLHICVDSSGVNLHFARIAHQAGIPVLYYIAPQLWASRPGRIKRVRRWVDRIACILPFEEEYYRRRGVNATFVGHPLFDELPADRKIIIAARDAAPRFPAVPPVIAIVPGSRRSEVSANFPHLLEIARRIAGEFPGAGFLVPTTPAVHAAAQEISRGTPNVECLLDGFDSIMPRCDLCLCKSGTSTLHAAAWGDPMIVVYRLSPFIWNVFGRFIVKTPKIALVNILAGNIDLVPEHIPWYGSNEPVAAEALDFLHHPEKLAQQRAKLLQLVDSLDKSGASRNAARIAIEMMNRS